MSSSEIEQLKLAEQLTAQGRRKEAAKALLQVHSAARDGAIKLQSIAMLVCTLNRVAQNRQIIDLCSEGINLAQAAKNPHLHACLLASKASNVNFAASELVHRRACLKMVGPGWIWLGFALESEATEYAALGTTITEYEANCDQLLAEAVTVAGDIPLTKAYVLVMKAEVLSRRHSYYQTMHMKWGQLVQWFHYIRPLKQFLMFSRSDRRTMKEIARSCIASYKAAASIYRKEGEEGEEAAVLLSLAVELCTLERFQEAVAYIPQLERAVNRLNREDLKVRIGLLRERIQTRNKSIPNYAEGEIRDID